MEPFVPDMFPDTLCDYVYGIVDRQQSPADFVAVSTLCGLASLIGV
ncbi:hypothetical protein V3565_04990 [Bartonella sp. B10]